MVRNVMAEDIDREAAVMKLMLDGCSAKNVQSVMDIPAADVAPVVHGKWVPSDGNPGFLVCSACGDCYVVDEWSRRKKWMYYPACGAKMAKEEDNDQT